MTATAPNPTKPEPALTVVLEEAGTDFAPRTRKSTADALSALKPSLDAVKSNPDKVYTIAKGLTPNKAASLVALLNDRYPDSWTFGGRSADDGSAVVQARYSEKPENKRPAKRVNKPRNPNAGKPAAKTVKR